MMEEFSKDKDSNKQDDFISKQKNSGDNMKKTPDFADEASGKILEELSSEKTNKEKDEFSGNCEVSINKPITDERQVIEETQSGTKEEKDMSSSSDESPAMKVELTIDDDPLGEEESQNEPEEETPSPFDDLKEKLDELSVQFETKLKYDQHKDAIIDKLHSELQTYKNDIYKKIMTPLVNEIITIANDYRSLCNNHKERGEENLDATKLLTQLGGVADDLEDALYKNGVDTFENEGNKFNPIKQTIIKIELTDDPEKDKTISKRVKKGYVWEEKIHRKENVNCYKYQQPKN